MDLEKVCFITKLFIKRDTKRKLHLWAPALSRK